MNTTVFAYKLALTRVAAMVTAILLFCATTVGAGEQQVVLRDYIQEEWKNELLTYSFSAPNGACHPDSVTLTGPRCPVPVQLSEIEYW